ncbi:MULTISPECIES: CoA-binding protein [Halorubrum]|uniref:acetate--CoA ligase (ADP-forming) n=1 Tax=Halorubrum tropicale TaxID=1765655 RepID=A0A0N0UAI0_9EURY|nr:CoA-binding protein [Halorubrum ezzemoulense]KOX95456.1 CoA-binding protein [Halorubrum tropicale]MDB2238987.1 CoA-binding protein [Halorubrum ezzemoulense]MDB2249724.1 CoA-binding protein [Halorubrum ezzemoulense]
MSLNDLFDPDSIAVIGASKTPGKLGNDAMANAKEFDGPVYPVNPSGDGSVYGYDFVESVADTDADLALCCVPGPVTPEVIEECGEAGVGAAVVFAGGFAEAGGQGIELQADVQSIAEEYDIAVLGPNTAGHIIPHRHLFSSFVPGFDEIDSGDVAIAAQSGGVGVTATFQLDREGYGTAGMYGLGNRVNTDFDEVIPMLDDDSEVDAIALHIEGTDQIDSVIEAVEAASTPVVALKSGNEMEEFVQAHTAAPIQESERYERPFTNGGAVMADSLTELLDASRVLAQCPQADGPNVGLVTAQAGPGIMMADYLDERGVNFPELTEDTRERLDDILPGFTYDRNPVDTGRPMPEFGDVIDAVGRDDNVDIVLVYEIFEHSLGYPVEELEQLTADIDKPVVFTVAGPDAALSDDRDRMEDLGVATFDSPERGAYAASVLAETSR